jgi:phospholipase B1, membrane-associated
VQRLNHGFTCSTLHELECPCGAHPKNDEEKAELIQFYNEYTRLIAELVDSGRYDGREDFTVVLQPFMEQMTIPLVPSGDIDLSYFAPDCFHFSVKGQMSAAMNLWNNMLEPVGQKSVKWMIDEKMLCPTEAKPYFFTKKNSN